jgi:wyosine [tRNA(Phe)-imidazoG37] synthetase (radical SAM superfamily)
MSSENEYTYGPVPSRRLGRSLGVDLVPPKTCDLNCVYCQLGPTAQTTVERREYVPVDDVVAEVRRELEGGSAPDYVTLGGSGEPTLHSGFGDIAAGIKRFTGVPIALLTNGTLFHLPEVRAACASIDLVLPSLDAGDEETFRRVNRPHPDLTLEQLVDGLAALRREFGGQMWLEVFLIEGVNSSDAQVRRIRECVERIDPHRVQLNTAVRPPAESNVRAVPHDRLEEIREMLGPRAEIIAPAAELELPAGGQARKERVLDMLRRRPCTLRDVAVGLDIHRNEAVKYVQALLEEGAVRRRQRLYQTYYEAADR